MKFLDTLLGRTKATAPNLDALFALPAAAVTLEAAVGLRPRGQAGVAYRPASGQAFAEVGEELAQLLQLSVKESATELRHVDDSFGYRWVVLADPELEDLVGSAHLVNASLEERGFGPQLLCSVFAFAGADSQPLHLVYLHKRGTFYPFAPRPGERRDNETELQVRGALQGDLRIEADLARWFPLWGVPL